MGRYYRHDDEITVVIKLCVGLLWLTAMAIVWGTVFAIGLIVIVVRVTAQLVTTARNKRAERRIFGPDRAAPKSPAPLAGSPQARAAEPAVHLEPTAGPRRGFDGLIVVSPGTRIQPCSGECDYVRHITGHRKIDGRYDALVLEASSWEEAERVREAMARSRHTARIGWIGPTPPAPMPKPLQRQAQTPSKATVRAAELPAAHADEKKDGRGTDMLATGPDRQECAAIASSPTTDDSGQRRAHRPNRSDAADQVRPTVAAPSQVDADTGLHVEAGAPPRSGYTALITVSPVVGDQQYPGEVRFSDRITGHHYEGAQCVLDLVASSWGEAERLREALARRDRAARIGWIGPTPPQLAMPPTRPAETRQPGPRRHAGPARPGPITARTREPRPPARVGGGRVIGTAPGPKVSPFDRIARPAALIVVQEPKPLNWRDHVTLRDVRDEEPYYELKASSTEMAEQIRALMEAEGWTVTIQRFAGH